MESASMEAFSSFPRSGSRSCKRCGLRRQKGPLVDEIGVAGFGPSAGAKMQ